jgi:hypothetical protein
VTVSDLIFNWIKLRFNSYYSNLFNVCFTVYFFLVAIYHLMHIILHRTLLTAYIKFIIKAYKKKTIETHWPVKDRKGAITFVIQNFLSVYVYWLQDRGFLETRQFLYLSYNKCDTIGLNCFSYKTNRLLYFENNRHL